MDGQFLDERRQLLEESFFRRRNTDLMDQLRKQVALEAKRAEFAMVSGIHDQKLLDRLINLNMSSGTVAALALVPMVRVAWADGKLDAAEREAILASAVKSGLHQDSAGYHWLITWLQQRPEPELLEAWTHYVQALKETLSSDDRQALKAGLIDRARQVAEATGGFLGLGNKISAEEQTVLEELETAFN
ncbi:MAG: hypothetical protein AAGF97_08925 [Planctomycetota bacterium]